MIYHIYLFLGYPFVGAHNLPILLKKAYLFVDMFFMMSGYILYFLYAEQLNQRKYRRVISYLVHRAARIMPLYYISLALYITVVWGLVFFGFRPSFFMEGASPIQLAGVLVFGQAWGFGGMSGWNSPSWSISAEIGAYILFPILVLRFGKISKTSWFLVSVGFFSYTALEVLNGSMSFVAWPAGLRGLSGFIIGMGLCVFQDKPPKPIKLLEKPVAFLICLSLLILTFGLPVPDVISLIFMAIMLLATSHDKGSIGKFFSYPLFQWVGERSFTIYMTHASVLLLVTDGINTNQGLGPLTHTGEYIPINK